MLVCKRLSVFRLYPLVILGRGAVLNLRCVPVLGRDYRLSPRSVPRPVFTLVFALLALQAFLTTWHGRLLW